MKKIIPVIVLATLVLFACPAIAQDGIREDQIMEGKIVEVLDEKEIVTEDGAKIKQQNLKIIITKGEHKGQEIVFEGISDLTVIAKNVYKRGDKVLLTYNQDFEGNDVYYVVDYVRTGKIYLLAIIFIIAVITVGRWKGLKSLISLIISFLVILKFIIPKILSGGNPLFITIIGGAIILFISIYLTQGFNKKSNLINLALVLSFILTAVLSFIFTNITKLTGFASEESIYLISLNQGTLNIKGLLLAGILIGVLGVLDDAIVSQVSTVEQIKKANPALPPREVYKRASKVGIDHISSMTNTLFFAYAGASLPLLILFNVKQPPFMTLNQIISNEIVATEIVRTLVGSIGLILAIPIANYLASHSLNVQKINSNQD